MAMVIALSGCATLPTTGPTAGQVRKAEMSDNPLGFRVLDLTPEIARTLNSTDMSGETFSNLASLQAAGPVNVVGPGDVLGINIFEVGVTLFGGQAGFGDETFDPTARGRTVAGVVVDQDGAIRLPYIGKLAVAGKTPAQIEQAIEAGLRGKSQAPQALVSIRENVVNTVYVSGAVNRPGRFPLTLARERLLDALAVSGGPSGPADSMVVRFSRGGRVDEARLSTIRTGSPSDLQLSPGDRIELIQRPKTYSVLGASNRVSLNTFETDRVTLAEAMAKVGGPNDQLADPRGIFLFRYTGAGFTDPVIYRINLMRPTDYFLAQQVQLSDKDLLYMSNSPANIPTKFISVLNQLFSPFLTARVLLDNNR